MSFPINFVSLFRGIQGTIMSRESENFGHRTSSDTSGGEGYGHKTSLDDQAFVGEQSQDLFGDKSPEKKKTRKKRKPRCKRCDKEYVSRVLLKEHLDLKVCQKRCKVDHQHEVIQLWFPSLQQAREHLKDKQWDRHLVVDHGDRSGNPYYRCFQSTKGRRSVASIEDKENQDPDDNPAPKRKQTGTPACPALLRIKKASDGRFLMSGCVKHSHTLDHFNARLSCRQKEKVDTMVQAGARPSVIYNRTFGTETANCDDEGVPLHAVSRSDIWNRTRAIDGDRLRKTDVEGVYDLVTRSDEVVAYALPGYYKRKAGDPKLVRHVRDLFVLRMTKFQQRLFNKHGQVLILDCSFNTNRNNFSLLVGVVLDSRGEGVPAFAAFGRSECEEFVDAALREVRRACPDGMAQVRLVVSDLSRALMVSIRTHFARNSQQISLVNCLYHVDKAWRSRIKDEEFVGRLLDLRLEGDPGVFMAKMERLKMDYGKEDNKSRKHFEYFDRNYGFTGIISTPQNWARCFTSSAPTTSIQCERSFATIKEHLNVRQRLDTALLRLRNVDAIYQNKAWCLEQNTGGVHRARAQERYEAAHIDSFLETAKVLCAKPGEEVIAFDSCSTSRNKLVLCNKTLCRVLCAKCHAKGVRSCAHEFFCTCMAFTFHGACQHQHHAVLEVLGLRRQVGSSLEATIIYDPTTASSQGRFPVQESRVCGHKTPPTQTSKVCGHETPPTQTSKVCGHETPPQQSGQGQFETSLGTDTEAHCRRELQKETRVALELASHRCSTEEGREQVKHLSKTLVAFNCGGQQLPPQPKVSPDVIGEFPDLRCHRPEKGSSSQGKRSRLSLTKQKDSIILYAISTSPSSQLWANLVAERKVNLQGRVDGSLGVEERATFWRLHAEAVRLHHVCVVCRSSDMESHLGGMTHCSMCLAKAHRTCTGDPDGNATFTCSCCTGRRGGPVFARKTSAPSATTTSSGNYEKGGRGSLFKTPWTSRM